MSKKGFEIQFNWMFVLIVGAAIILFFAAIAVKQKDVSESSAKVTLLRKIEGIIYGASASTDTTTQLSLPDHTIRVECNKISLGNIQRQYLNLILFAPSELKGGSFITQALGFNLPYRSTNLLLLTSPKIKYILIGNNNLAKELNRTMASDLDKENYPSYDETKIKYQRSHRVRFIFVNTNLPTNVPNSLAKMRDEDISALKVNGDIDKGTLEFYEKKNNKFISKSTSMYVAKSSLAGAVYSDDEELYSCSMKNAFSRLKMVTNVYAERATKLKDSTSLSTECRSIYANALTYLNIIQDSASRLIEDIKNFNDINKLNMASNELSKQNKEAQKFSCPLIY